MTIRKGAPITIAALCLLSLMPTTVSAAKRVVYINFGPETINNAAAHDPSMNSYNTNGFTPGDVTGWPALTDQQKNEILWLMKETAVAFDMEFVTERPAAGNYDMLVMGDDVNEGALFPGLAGCSTAISVADCTDGNLENISFLFWGCLSEAQQMDMKRVVHTAFTGMGFGWGLEQTSVAGEIMGGYTATALEFSDACRNLSGAGQCTHVGCAADQQNATADLNGVIGPRVDDGPPVVTITEPADGAMVSKDFDVRADVADAFGGLTVSLEIVEAMQVLEDANNPQWEYSWGLTGVPDGLWTLKVTAQDADMNITEQEIQVCVGETPCDMGTTGGSTSGSTGGGSSTGGSTGSTGGDTDSTSTSTTGPVTTTAPPPTTTTFGMDEATTGCGCRNRGGDDFPLGWLALAPLLVRRRRVTPRG